MNETVLRNMRLLIVTLVEDTYLEEIILGLTGISGGLVTMIDGISGSHKLSLAIPMFASFTGIGGKRFCKILVTCVTGEDPAGRLIGMLKDGGLDFTRLEIGEIYTFPLAEAVVVEDLEVL